MVQGRRVDGGSSGRFGKTTDVFYLDFVRLYVAHDVGIAGNRVAGAGVADRCRQSDRPCAVI